MCVCAMYVAYIVTVNVFMCRKTRIHKVSSISHCLIHKHRKMLLLCSTLHTLIHIQEPNQTIFISIPKKIDKFPILYLNYKTERNMKICTLLTVKREIERCVRV